MKVEEHCSTPCDKSNMIKNRFSRFKNVNLFGRQTSLITLLDLLRFCRLNDRAWPCFSQQSQHTAWRSRWQLRPLLAYSLNGKDDQNEVVSFSRVMGCMRLNDLLYALLFIHQDGYNAVTLPSNDDSNLNTSRN